MDETKYTEALPILEKIAKLEPNDGETQFNLGFALAGQAANTKDDAARKALRVRSRAAFVKAKSLGHSEPRLDALIAGLPEDGSDAEDFSPNSKANDLVKEGEALFSQGKKDEALKKYQEALAVDPKAYYAALFSGDIYLQKQDYAQAETWYQKAIGIDPTKETAYRYSATPLMRQRKFDAARDRYIEAFITEPYNRFAQAGLVQWGEATGTQLAHPRIDIPTNITFDEKGYRHSLAEEVDALRTVLRVAAEKKPKSLTPSLAKLKKLDEEGLLEAYVLIARPDDGIAADHPVYLKDNRDNLRRYVLAYVVTGGGK